MKVSELHTLSEKVKDLLVPADWEVDFWLGYIGDGRPGTVRIQPPSLKEVHQKIDIEIDTVKGEKAIISLNYIL